MDERRWQEARPLRPPAGPRWTPLDRMRRAVEFWRDEGCVSLVMRLVGVAAYRRWYLLERRLDSPAGPKRIVDGLEMGLLAADEIAELARLQPFGPPEHKLRAWLDNGRLCFVGRMDQRIVGVRWAATGSATFSLLERELPLRPDEVYFLEVYTSRPYRGRGVYQALAAFSDEHYRQAGFRIGLTSTFPWNKRALRAIQRAGYRPVAVVGRWKVGRWRRDFYRPVSTEGNPRVSP